MKYFFTLFLLIGVAQLSRMEAQDTLQHQIVFQLQSSDTMAHKSLMKQLNNIISNFPNATIEVVCHGPGLNILVTQTTIVGKKIQELSEKGVHFVACEFSMSERKVSKEELLKSALTTKYGIMEIVRLQENGYSYIKAGF
jgi:uncharacterized protein